MSLLYPCGALTSWKKLEKTNEWSLRYLLTDQQTDIQEPLLRTPTGRPGVQNRPVKLWCSKYKHFKFQIRINWKSTWHSQKDIMTFLSFKTYLKILIYPHFKVRVFRHFFVTSVSSKLPTSVFLILCVFQLKLCSFLYIFLILCLFHILVILLSLLKRTKK